jgi:hypothetical protein
MAFGAAEEDAINCQLIDMLGVHATVHGGR